MDSPLTKIVLSVLGGYAAILLLLTAWDRIEKEFPAPPGEPVAVKGIQHPFYHRDAVHALERFGRLSTAGQNRMKTHLHAGFVSMEEWVPELDRSDFQVLCLGESHENPTRHFLADHFFSRLPMDMLFLEATPKEVKGLIRRMAAGRSYFPLLDADMMGILRAATRLNPDLGIFGIEQRPGQERSTNGNRLSRDQAITRNFREEFQPGLRHVILFGGLHCTNEPNWLFGNIRATAPGSSLRGIRNIRVLEAHENGAMEAFVFFLDHLDIRTGEDFVIPDTSALPPLIFQWFPALARQILDKFPTVIVFRTPSTD